MVCVRLRSFASFPSSFPFPFPSDCSTFFGLHVGDYGGTLESHCTSAWKVSIECNANIEPSSYCLPDTVYYSSIPIHEDRERRRPHNEYLRLTS